MTNNAGTRHTPTQVNAGAGIFAALTEARGFEQADRMFYDLCHSLTGDWTSREIEALRVAVIARFHEDHGQIGYGVMVRGFLAEGLSADDA